MIKLIPNNIAKILDLVLSYPNIAKIVPNTTIKTYSIEASLLSVVRHITYFDLNRSSCPEGNSEKNQQNQPYEITESSLGIERKL